MVKENPLTRRGVLSTVASVYDPLGFVAPFILVGKQILQALCRDKIRWDEDLPEHILPQWESWLKDLPHLAALKIPRSYLPSSFGEVMLYELHNFSDASLSGYGACSYLRAINKTGQISCSLVMGKARVAPTKLMTIPRLELSSAVTSVRNGDVVKRELDVKILQEYYWTDSKVVLGYINNDAKRFHTFVANRIQRIRSSTNPEQWRHVSSENNPADYASRGLNAVQLKESNWLKGPDFLWQQNLPCEEEMVGEVESTDPELRKAHVHPVKTEEFNSMANRFTKFSDWSRAVRAVARLKSALFDPGVAHLLLQWCRNPGGGCQHTEGVSAAEEKAVKTLVHLHLASWQELQAVFQDSEKHWKQLEEQQVEWSGGVRWAGACWRSGNPQGAWGQEPPSHHPSTLQSQVQGGMEPFFLLLFLYRGRSELTFSPLPHLLPGCSELWFLPLPSLLCQLPEKSVGPWLCPHLQDSRSAAEGVSTHTGGGRRRLFVFASILPFMNGEIACSGQEPSIKSDCMSFLGIFCTYVLPVEFMFTLQLLL
ncbi:hypothetical protein SRHO_G00004660 [Serrasalmus rhombeus]